MKTDPDNDIKSNKLSMTQFRMSITKQQDVNCLVIW